MQKFLLPVSRQSFRTNFCYISVHIPFYIWNWCWLKYRRYRINNIIAHIFSCNSILVFCLQYEFTSQDVFGTNRCPLILFQAQSTNQTSFTYLLFFFRPSIPFGNFVLLTNHSPKEQLSLSLLPLNKNKFLKFYYLLISAITFSSKEDVFTTTSQSSISIEVTFLMISSTAFFKSPEGFVG